MQGPSTELRAQLIQALAESDNRTREARSERIVWLSEMPSLPTAYVGRFEQLQLLEEVRQCFVNGNYIAVLLAATAFAEQTLIEELEMRQHQGPRRNLGSAIESARHAGILPNDLLDRTDKLRLVRNPFGHYRPEGDPDAVVTRYRARSVHPVTVLEEDAKLAVRVVFEMFLGTLRYT